MSNNRHLGLSAGALMAVVGVMVAVAVGVTYAQTGGCPTGQHMENNICVADTTGGGTGTCPTGTTGIPPNCVGSAPATCPTGERGTPPNCEHVCPDGVTWVGPSGTCPTATTNTTTNTGTNGAACPSDKPIKCSDNSCEPTQLACSAKLPCPSGQTKDATGTCVVTTTTTTNTNTNTAGTCPQDKPIQCSNNTCALTQLECSSLAGCSAGQIKDSTGQCVPSTTTTTDPAATNGAKCPVGQFLCQSLNKCADG
ncbi:MAG: hypothetical protein AAB592_02740, partial [Patescibacteria group bacterium]